MILSPNRIDSSQAQVFTYFTVTYNLINFQGGLNIPGEDARYDFGTGAGFYVDATEEPWKNNYNMYSYINKELQEVVNSNFSVDPDRQSIMGHR